MKNNSGNFEEISFTDSYTRDELPVSLNYRNSLMPKEVTWNISFEQIDYQRMLPLFCDGLKENQHPFPVLVERGLHDLVENGIRKINHKVLQKCMPFIRKALLTQNDAIVLRVTRFLKKFLECGQVRSACLLLCFARYFLTPYGTYIRKQPTKNFDDDSHAISEIMKFLETMERYGGQEALNQIKSRIPTYHSALQTAL